MIKKIQKAVKKYWDEERLHKKSDKYACSGNTRLYEYSHFMFADFLFDELNLHGKVDRREFEIYCYELLKQGEEFIMSEVVNK